MDKSIFHSLLLWYDAHKRAMPWRGEEDPYKIWVSEIILQQTRVNQGWDYYERFIARFPTFFALSEAPLEAVLLVWQGLGYYSRARNMHIAAKQIVSEFQGKFPNNFQQLLQLKGVGRYTAAAIASIAFHEKKGAVDGNVLRVVSRLYGIFEDISTGKAARHIESIVDASIIDYPPREFNQALIELGATVCKPTNALCGTCPLANHCYAYIHEKQKVLPIKNKKIKVQTRYLHFFYYEKEGEILIEQRSDKEIWKHLYQLPLVETVPNELLEQNGDFMQLEASDRELLWKTSQKLTHQTLHIHFWKANELSSRNGTYFFVAKKEIKKYPFPKIIAEFFKNNGIPQ